MCVSDIGLCKKSDCGAREWRESRERGAGGTDLQVGERTICVGAHLIAYTAYNALMDNTTHTDALIQ